MSLINNLKTPVDIYSVADVAFRLLSCLSWLLLVGQNHSVSQSLTGTKPAGVAVAPSKAKEFLTSLRRPKRNIWDRSRPDVQQWIMQFMHMGYDEARLETDLSYWMDLARSSDQGRQHHYDENAPIGPQDPGSYRHGANVNYDYY
uniref:ECRG4 augurin n=1 Tax=Oncorhynchus mykiss TaxID=8022 RepID=A0A8K9WY71_ONCMY